LIEQKSDKEDIRVWVPGCSSGEEVYSLAIIISELLEEYGKTLDVQIFGTDIDLEAIATARTGVYPSTIATDVSPERLKKFFIKKDNFFYIKNHIREMAVFAPHDVITDPPFTRLDLISCRNLLIYLNGEAQQKIISNFNYGLNKNGILFLGPSESVGEFVDAFDILDRKWKVFKCIKPTEFVRRFVELHPIPQIVEQPNLFRGVGFENVTNGPLAVNISVLAEKELMNTYVPPSAIITDHGEILYIHGRLGKYIEPSEGRPKLNIFDMAREGLKFELNSAIESAISNKKEVVLENLRIKDNGNYNYIDLSVKPLKNAATKGLLSISFKEIQVNQEAEEKIKLDIDTKGVRKIRELEDELRLTKERLNTTIEEMTSSNEELRSANEELQSMNEEAQSTNEELETSKEELQSVNEEMITVNNELQMKIDELTKIKDDMNNLFNSIEIPIIFLDKDMKIRRFTKESSQMIKMIESDIGRPLSDISSSNLKYEDLMDDIQTVIQRVIFKEKEIQTQNDDWYLVKIMPYKTSENVIDGAILTFTNITELKCPKLNE
jgi:two-component system CheB/CheR fusion protein